MPDGDVGAQIEALLGELLDQSGHQAADTGEKIVRLLVEYYGAGLARVCEIVGADRPDLVHQLAADPLVESQLILHGLHPLTVDRTHRGRAGSGARPISARTPAGCPSSASTRKGSPGYSCPAVATDAPRRR